MRSALFVFVTAIVSGCPAPAPLAIDVDHTTIDADGLARAHITVTAHDPIEGAVVQLTSDGGALTSSAAALVNGAASVDLIAPLERELGKKSTRPIVVTATIAVDAKTTLSATTTITARAPTSGPPLLFVTATPAAAVAGSGTPIAIDVQTRRVAKGTALHVDDDAHALTFDTAAPIVDANGVAHATATAPASAADATITVADPASGVSSSIVVRFVKAGDPLYDLNGFFVQIGPARVKLVSGGLLPNPQCAVAPSIVLVQFAQDGTHLDAHYTTCDVTFPSVTSIVGSVTDEATDSFYAAIPVVHQQFDLDTKELGANYAPPPSVVVVGANLTDPEHDKLPTDATDPRVVDADGDGQPGVTVQNSIGGEQHIVFRNVGTSKGHVLSSNEILGDDVGDLVAVTETSVFGIGGSFLPDTTALGSVVEVLRIDGQYGSVNADANGDNEITCAEAIEAAGNLDDLVVPDTPFDCGADK